MLNDARSYILQGPFNTSEHAHNESQTQQDPDVARSHEYALEDPGQGHQRGKF